MLFKMPWFRIGQFILYELSNALPLIEPILDGNVRILTKYNIEIEKAFGLSKEDLDRMFLNQADLFVYIEDDMPLGMMWGHRGSCYVRGPGIPLFLDSETIYWFWILTLPEARGRGVYKRLKSAFFLHYNAVKCFTALIQSGNSIMKKEVVKMGFIDSKRIVYVKINDASLVITRCNKSKTYSIRLAKETKYNLPII
jgi:hypothetical protein